MADLPREWRVHTTRDLSDRGRSIRVDLRVVTIGALLVGVGALVALLIVAGSDAALTKTALVLAVVAFIADLVIALASYMIGSQAEARLQDTNAQMQATLAAVNEQTNEIRNLARSQVSDLIDRLAPRVVAEAPPDERPQIEAAFGTIREQLQGDFLRPPEGGKQGREQRLRASLSEWIDRNGFERVQNPRGYKDDVERFLANGVIYAVEPHAGLFERNVDDLTLSQQVVALKEDWADKEVRRAVVIEPPEVSGWNGYQVYELRVVTTANLDDILKEPPTSNEETGFVPA
jgi:multisubunit Na+/H+ antiporter MnhF subunit